jgi:hypothetical protein
MKGDIVLEFVSTKHQLAHILTKSLSKDHFCKKKHLSFIHVIDVWVSFYVYTSKKISLMNLNDVMYIIYA